MVCAGGGGGDDDDEGKEEVMVDDRDDCFCRTTKCVSVIVKTSVGSAK